MGKIIDHEKLLEAIRGRCDFLEELEYIGTDQEGRPLFTAFDVVYKREMELRLNGDALEGDYGYGGYSVIAKISLDSE
ncbi:hypothetical protein DNHGIG_03560 [Collibacillus ludicampi]|jgi:hypothetical protein|uniref:Uncharacterized protein n=1 Tax=Collibacillus ludicampi TaxID=2771369 RepID=A0AAV4LAH9_9BACL|nr:hypothetical protein [Collibacillus ludicampi]GIM44807.1 hypothetical protein DNHGIG_03560 [Collibacillus ludicampi]